jgi:hypothetical protein
VDIPDGQPTRERTDKDAGEDVAHNERLSHALRQKAPGDGRNQDERDIGDEFHGLCRVHMRSTNAKSRKALARRYDRSGMINACEIWRLVSQTG